MIHFIIGTFVFVFSHLSHAAGNAQYCENNTNTADEYRQCMGEKKVEEKEVDSNSAAEDACINDPKKTVEQRKACMELEETRRQDRAQVRHQKEMEALPPHIRDTASDATKNAGECEFKEVQDQCYSSYKTAFQNKTDENAKLCAKSCLINTYQNTKRLTSCTDLQKKSATRFLSKYYPTCGVGGAELSDEDKIAQCKRHRGVGAAETCERINDPHNGEFREGEEGKEAYKVVNSGGGDVVYKDGNTIKTCANGEYNLMYCRSINRDGSSTITVEDSRGNTYESWADARAHLISEKVQNEYSARNGEWQGPRVPEGWEPPAGTAAVRDPVVPQNGGSGSGSGSASGATTRSTGDSQSISTNKDTLGGSGAPPAATETPKPQSNPQQTAGMNGGGASSGGASSGSSSGGSNAFSNPYANTNLAANKPTDRQSFAALSDKDSSSYRDEGVGADSGGSQSYDGGGFNQRNNGGYRGGSSEGVNREAPVGRSSLGSGGAVGVAASHGARDSSMKAKLEELGGSTFQSGFHKANGKEPLSPSSLSKTKAQLAKMSKAKRKKVMDQCKGDMSCIASILGVTKSRRGAGGRGLASLPGASLPQGVWSGHTDILSHMEKVHDKMPINYDGEIDD